MTSASPSARTPSRSATRQRVANAVLAFLCVGAAMFWSLALREALRPSPPSVLVRAPEYGRPNGPYPVQVLAFDPIGKKQVSLVGHVGFDRDGLVPLQSNLATLVLPASANTTSSGGEQGQNEHTILLHIDVMAWESHVRFEIPVVASSSERRGALPRWTAWDTALAAPSPADLNGNPIYPLAGQVRSSLPSEVLVLRANEVSRERLSPHAAYARLADGRHLKLDRSGVTISMPPFMRTGDPVPLRIQSSNDSERLLSVFVDGQLQQVLPVSLRAGENQVQVAMSSSTRSSAVFEIHLSVSAFNPTSASTAIGMLWDDPRPFEASAISPTLAERLQRTALFEGVSDPLLDALFRGTLQASPEIWQGIFARFRSRLRFPGRVGPSAEEQQLAAQRARVERTAQFRHPFRVCAVLLGLLGGAIAWRAGQKRRALDELLRLEWQNDDEETGALPSRWQRLGGALWATLGLAAAFATLWALDWALHFVLLMG